MTSSLEEERIWHYQLDKEGHLWHEGSEFDDPAILKFFMRKMEKLPDGRFKAICQGETCFIEPEDVPYVVKDVVVGPDQVELIFPGDYGEVLDPSTLYVGKENVLYCKVRGGKYAARFNRKTYFELARLVEQDAKDKGFYLAIGGKRYRIREK